MKTKESGKPAWTDTRQLDLMANELTEIEIQPELSLPGRFKLYVHQDGVTLVRVCKLTIDQIVLNGDCGLQKTH